MKNFPFFQEIIFLSSLISEDRQKKNKNWDFFFHLNEMCMKFSFHISQLFN